VAPKKNIYSIEQIQIRSERDIVTARQRARRIAALAGLPSTEQAAIAKAVSEVARNAWQYAGGGKVEFAIDMSGPEFLSVEVSDEGPGIADVDAVLNGQYESTTGLGIGLAGTRRLTERFEIETGTGGTRVRFGRTIPAGRRRIDAAAIADQIANEGPPEWITEVRQQDRDLLGAIERVRAQEEELRQRTIEMGRLNLELEETNRGVVALYGELEERAAALRRANELKSQFLSHVSHEFRTPVNSIAALTHLLLRHTDGPLTSEQEKQVSFIRQAATGLSDMVNDLLDFAKVESGKTEVRVAPLEVSQVLGAVRALMRPLATNDAVTLVFEEPAEPIVMKSDEAKIGQILRNLVSNALKFTERGEVRVSARLESAELVQFFVSDTGIGIAPEDLETVFEEFAQIQHSVQRKVKGTGLGLSLSRKLAGLLGGTLQVSSALGSGSTFTLTLPVKLAQKEEAADEMSAAVPVQSRGGTVLIVDDEEAARYICKQMFRGSPYRIIESEGREAAERARFERPRLILLDLIMPGRTGFEVLDELKSDPSTREIPVVIHTSKATTEADLHRLRGRHVGILYKSGAGRRSGMEAIREVLGDPSLFGEEPEFGGATEGF